MRPSLRDSIVRLTFVSTLLLFGVVQAAQAQPTFAKAFAPDTIGPGAVSTLTFTITNGTGTPVTSLAFSDTFPANMVIATPSSAATTCTEGVVVAPNGGTTISLSAGKVAGNSSCTVTVNVVATATGTNTSGDLTSSAPNSGTAMATLTVSTSAPGFSKAFSPSTVPIGGRSTLTFTIDNSANGGVETVGFTDTLPPGMVVGDPANIIVNGCLSVSSVTAVPGAGVVSVVSAIVLGDATCTVKVDVIGGAAGALNNVSGPLFAGPDEVGSATATLTVTASTLQLTKSFTNDPVAPGGSVVLKFTIENKDRGFQATGIGFTDNLATTVPTLAALVATGLPLNNVCGTGSSLTSADDELLTFAGGTLAAEASCNFSVTLQVPSAAAAGTYTNTTSAVTGTINGSGVTGNQASDTLFVQPIWTCPGFVDGYGLGLDRHPRFGLAAEPSPVEHFALERGEEALGHGIEAPMCQACSIATCQAAEVRASRERWSASRAL